MNNSNIVRTPKRRRIKRNQRKQACDEVEARLPENERLLTQVSCLVGHSDSVQAHFSGEFLSTSNRGDGAVNIWYEAELEDSLRELNTLADCNIPLWGHHDRRNAAVTAFVSDGSGMISFAGDSHVIDENEYEFIRFGVPEKTMTELIQNVTRSLKS